MVGKIFLSYAREDLDMVRWEAQTMQMLGHDVFLDVDSLRAGVEWPAALRDEIRAADRFILFWSAFSARSDWVKVGNAFFMDQVGLTTQVLAWPYDWRLSVADVADQLAMRLRDLLAKEGDSELVFVGFGHGCAVLRALAAFHHDLWHQARSGGAPLVFVAPSEHGTWRAAEVLLNGNQILKTIGLLDLKHSARQIHDLFAGFPAVLEMLPSSPAADLFAPEWWHGKARQPAEFALQQARQTRAALLAAIPPAEILYVVGESATTPAGVVDDAGELRWLKTSEGDGSTPWALGVIPGVRAFRAGMDASEILDNPVAVRAISDLIAHGVTNLLPPHAPAPR